MKATALVLTILLTAFMARPSTARDKPNIVVILADDLGYGEFPVPTVDGLTEPDWNDPRWRDPGDLEDFRAYLLERKAEKLKALQKKTPEKPGPLKEMEPVE
jgi:hypothetical protein